MRLDHLAIGAETLEEGASWAEETFGVRFLPGGKHLRFGTHNCLLGLADGLYLEVITVDPENTPDHPRWFNMDAFSGPPRMVNWICEPDDFDGALAHGMKAVPMERGNLRWDIGTRPDGTLPLDGAYPTVLRWHTDTSPGRSLPESGVALTELTVSHPRAMEVEAAIGADLSDPRVTFQTGTASLSARFQTPNGEVTV